jgi:hypothetical protein
MHVSQIVYSYIAEYSNTEFHMALKVCVDVVAIKATVPQVVFLEKY